MNQQKILEENYRNQVNRLIKERNDVYTSSTYQSLTNKFNSDLLRLSNSNQKVFADNIKRDERKDKIYSELSINKLLGNSEKNNLDVAEQTKSNNFIKNIFYYGIIALIYWLINNFF